MLLPAARNLTILGSISASLPRLSPIITPLLWRLSKNLSPAVIGRETLKRVEARYKAIEAGEFYDADGAPQCRDMLIGFIESKNSQTKRIFTKAEVMSNTTSAFGAGSESTAVALDAFFYYVLREPEIYARVMEELDHAVKSGLVTEFPVLYAVGTKLEYLQACIKESMRLMTPVSMEYPRYVISGGLLVAGRYFLPGGTEIGASPFTFHRARAVYGEDAELFRPDRWLDITEEQKSRLEHSNLAVSGLSILV